MRGPRLGLVSFLLVGISSAVLSLATVAGALSPEIAFEPGLAWLRTGVAAGLFTSAGAAFLGRHRASGDPHALFVGASFLVVGLQGVVLGVWARDRFLMDSSPGMLLAWSGTWVVAGTTLALAHPWRERRGRPPARRTVVLVATVAGVALIDLVAALVGTAILPGIEPGAVLAGSFSSGVLTLIMAIAAAIVLIATARELWPLLRKRPSEARDDLTSSRPWLSIAYPMAIVGVAIDVVTGTAFTSLVPAYNYFLPLAGVAALTGVLLDAQEEASRTRRATDRAQAVMGGRAEIASTLAHEVRSPVATIKSLASTTSQNYDRLSHAERREFVGLIEQEASRLLDTVGQASLALKVDAGTLVYDRRRLDLATAVREGIESAETAGHYLTAELAPGLVAAVDRMHLAEAVRQVVDNAAKFSPLDAPIRVTSAVNGEDALIEVADGGPGIPEERREEVFERFASWRPAGYEDRPGAGLGLFISRAIVSEHGGDMVIDDAPDGGTIIQIRIPVEG